MHLVAGIGTAEMGDAGPGQEETRGLGMVNGREHLSALEQLCIVDTWSGRRPRDQRRQPFAGCECTERNIVKRRNAGDRPRVIAVRLYQSDMALAVIALELDHPHALLLHTHPPSTMKF